MESEIGFNGKYFISYTNGIEYHGGTLMQIIYNKVIDEHPLLWLDRTRCTLIFWSEIGPDIIKERQWRRDDKIQQRANSDAVKIAEIAKKKEKKEKAKRDKIEAKRIKKEEKLKAKETKKADKKKLINN